MNQKTSNQSKSIIGLSVEPFQPYAGASKSKSIGVVNGKRLAQFRVINLIFVKPVVVYFRESPLLACTQLS